MLSGNNLFKATKHFGSHLTNCVGLRWKTRPRKPFWLGLGKTKMFVLPEKKVDPPEEAAEAQRLQSIYDRQMRALHNFMTTDFKHRIEKQKDSSVADYRREAELLHERWNAESARLREERLKKEERETSETILKKVLEKQEMLKDIKVRVDNIVQREIEMSTTYITEKNLDEAIDICLASVSNYNYALDLSGNIYEGDSMTPTVKVKPVGASTETMEMIPKSSSSKENQMSGGM